VSTGHVSPKLQKTLNVKNQAYTVSDFVRWRSIFGDWQAGQHGSPHESRGKSLRNETWPHDSQRYWISGARIGIPLLELGLTQHAAFACGSTVLFFLCRSFFALRGEKTTDKE